MRTLILYATKSGASMECANLIATKIDNCSIYDLSKSAPDISSFDTVIIGSGVRMGKFYKPVLAFIEKNEDLLLAKKIAFYLCSAYPDTLQKTVEKNIPVKLMQSAACIKSFGGKPPFRGRASGQAWRNDAAIADFISVVYKTDNGIIPAGTL